MQSPVQGAGALSVCGGLRGEGKVLELGVDPQHLPLVSLTGAELGKCPWSDVVQRGSEVLCPGHARCA